VVKKRGALPGTALLGKSFHVETGKFGVIGSCVSYCRSFCSCCCRSVISLALAVSEYLYLGYLRVQRLLSELSQYFLALSIFAFQICVYILFMLLPIFHSRWVLILLGSRLGYSDFQSHISVLKSNSFVLGLRG